MLNLCLEPYNGAPGCTEMLLNGILTEWLNPVDSFQKIDCHKICGNLRLSVMTTLNIF